MKFKANLTKQDLIVVLGCVVFVLANLGAIGSSGRRRAKEAVCLCNLLQWGRIWKSYTDDNDGYFLPRNSGDPGGANGHCVVDWPNAVRQYYPHTLKPWGSVAGGNYVNFVVKAEILFCPEAPKTFWEGARNPYMGWEDYIIDDDDDDLTYGYKASYGMNLWVSNSTGGGKLGGGQEFWRTPYVTGAAYVPVMLDAQWKDADPLQWDEPPEHEDDIWTPNQDEMRRFCVNRHNGAVNGVFLDFSARKVGLKELWKLKWHCTYDVNAPPPVWPPWMENFKDY